MATQNWWKNAFVLSTFSSIQHGDNIEQIIALLAEVGLDTVECNCPLEYRSNDPTRDEILYALEACEKHSLRFIITDHKRMTGVPEPSKDTLASLVDDYSHCPALAGYYVWDEPDIKDFGAVRKMYDILQSLDPARLALNAVVPSYGRHNWPDDYPAFVRRFVDEVNPPVLSFDFYSVSQEDSNKPDSPIKINQELFRDLALWSSISSETGKPLWFYPSACRWHSIAKPSRATLSFQVYTAIAYGAKGIQYFQARGFTGGPVDFIDAAVGSDGTKGTSFDLLKSFNLEIGALSQLLGNLKKIKVMHTPPVPPNNYAFEPGTESLIEASDNLIVAFHEGPRKRKYIVVVNKDANSPTTASLVFSKQVDLLRMPEKSRVQRKRNTFELELEAGGGILLELRA